MLAVRSVSHQCSDPPIVSANHYTYVRQSLNNSFSVPLENCTAAHFSKIPYISQNYQILSQRNWMCLPLNSTFEIGGDWDINDVYKSLAIHGQCNSTCGTGPCGTLAIYQLHTTINVNQFEPIQYSLTRDDI